MTVKSPSVRLAPGLITASILPLAGAGFFAVVSAADFLPLLLFFALTAFLPAVCSVFALAEDSAPYAAPNGPVPIIAARATIQILFI